MSSSAFTSGVAATALVLASLVVSREARSSCLPRPPESVRSIDPAAREGAEKATLSSALLGGFRGLAADVIWLRAYVAWERHDARLVASLVDLATKIDERPMTFWLNGARMIAYDLPVWEIERRAVDGPVGEIERERVQNAAALQALSFLENGIRAHPMRAALRIEYANLQLNRLFDVEGAAATYRSAAELSDAPFYAGRLHGELLRRLGRRDEALAWLTHLHPRLPQHVEAAGADVVLGRIRVLEAELGIAPINRYHSPNKNAEDDPTLTAHDAAR